LRLRSRDAARTWRRKSRLPNRRLITEINNSRSENAKLHPLEGSFGSHSSLKPVKNLENRGCRGMSIQLVSISRNFIDSVLTKNAIGKRRQRLLDSLSTYNHNMAWKQAHSKRHGNTCQWLAQSSEFDRWMRDTGSPVLWCSGKREYRSHLSRVRLMTISSRIWEDSTHVRASTAMKYQALADS
jgi:hypothetical protein